MSKLFGSVLDVLDAPDDQHALDELNSLIPPVEFSQKRLEFGGEAKNLTVFNISDLLLHDEEPMVPAISLQMPQDVEAITALHSANPGSSATGDCFGVSNACDPIPVLPQGCIRVYVTQDIDPKVFTDDFDLGVGDTVRLAHALPRSRGYYGLSNQWRRLSPEAWFEATSLLISRDPPEGMMFIKRKACTLERSDGSLTLLISSETYGFSGFFGLPRVLDDNRTANRKVLESFQEFCLDFQHLGQHYQLILEGSKGARKRQILLLWFSHAQLFQALRQMEDAKRIYQQRIESQVDARKTELLTKLMAEVISAASLFKELEALAGDFATALECLIDVINIGSKDLEAKGPHELHAITADLRGLISDLRRRAGDVPKTFEHHLMLSELRRNLRESKGIWMLTVLASLFLPFSVASGILSMQTRLKDLHFLLYDFCGVVVILFTLVALLLFLVRASMGASEWIKSTTSSWNSLPKRAFGFVLTNFVIQFGAAIFASFIVGMTKSVRLGGIILGAAALYFVIWAAMLWAIYRYYGKRLLRINVT